MIWHFQKKLRHLTRRADLWISGLHPVSLASYLNKNIKRTAMFVTVSFHKSSVGQHCFTWESSIQERKIQRVCVTVPWKWKALDSLWKPWTWVTPSKPSPSVSSSNTLMRRAGSTPKPTTNLQTQKHCCYCYYQAMTPVILWKKKSLLLSEEEMGGYCTVYKPLDKEVSLFFWQA